MNKIKKTLYSNEEMLNRFKAETERILSAEGLEGDTNVSKDEIQELLHQIQVQQIELEMQNDELRISNEEVENQRYKFAGLYDLAPVGYFILDSHGIIQEVNSTGCNQLESLRRNIVNRRFQSFIHPDEGDAFFSFLRRTINLKNRQSCQLTLITPKGKTLFAQIEGVSVNHNLTQQQDQCYIAVIDFTERREADLKLRETKERLELALDASVAGTWQIDLQTEQISLDEFSCEIYGLQHCENIQTIDTFIKMIHPDDRRRASKRFGEAISHKWDLDVEYRIIKPDENIAYVSARGHVIETDASSICFVGILLDITERKQLEKEGQKLKEEHQKNLLKAIFVTQENERKRISEALHDSVSQLLYGIKLKLQDYKKSDKSDTVFDELNKLIEQAVKETRDISFELAPSILNDFGLPIAIEEMTKRLGSKKLRISTKIAGFKERLELNKELSIFRIVQELVNNVLKHANASLLTIELLRKNKNLTITVTDNGQGFSKGNDLNVTGSGLHSIRNRLDLLNGNMKIESSEGTGATVKITFRDIV
ncbi:MAG: PAS domain-containing sensor histidine kinase [Sphingobacteriaceae bacterium]